MLVLFHIKSYVNGNIVEAGQVVGVPDDFPMHAHMQNVETGKLGELPHPFTPHTPVFLDHSGDAYTDRDGSSGYNPALAAAREKKG